MSLSLVTFGAGAVIDASVMRNRLEAIELYLNEGIVAADRGAAWLSANHLYRPDFFGAPDPHTSLVSGETYFRTKSQDDAARTFFSANVNTASWMPVPGLCATIQIPQSLRVGATYYRLNIFASFYVYEYGGYGSGTGVDQRCDENENRAASVSLFLGNPSSGAGLDGTLRHVYKGSQTSDYNAGALFPRKQYSMAYSTSLPVAPGTYSLGVACRTLAPGANAVKKHVVFQQGSLMARYFLR